MMGRTTGRTLERAAQEHLHRVAARHQAALIEACARLAGGEVGEHTESRRDASPRFLPFVELFEVPLRDEVRGLLRDAEARAGVRRGAITRGVDDELRDLSRRDVPVGAPGSRGASWEALERQLLEAARRYLGAAADVLKRRLEILEDLEPLS